MLAYKFKVIFYFLLFVLIVDSYVWQAVKTIIKRKSKLTKTIVAIIYWSIPIISFIIICLVMFNDTFAMMREARTLFQGFLMVIYGSKLISFLFLIVDDIKRFFIWIYHRIVRLFSRGNSKIIAEDIEEEREEELEEAILPSDQKINRSEFLAKAGLIAGVAPLVFLTRGIYSGAYNYQVRRLDLVLPNLPEAFDGLKILQISDVHSGSFTDKDAVYRGIQLIKEQKAHVTFFTGDIVNNRTEELNDYMDMFSEIKSPMGVYSTLGNHDYGDYVNNWRSPEHKKKNFDDLVAAHKNMGWNLLRNEHVLLEKENKRIAILGVENWGDKGRFQKFGDVDLAKKAMPDAPVKLLLSHDPSHFDKIISKHHKDIDITFSGHTHGFQFGVEFGNIKWSPSQYLYPYWADLYKVDKQMIYVNRGFGFIGYPGRVGILPEITVFTLFRA